MQRQYATHPSRLLSMAQSLSAATESWSTDPSLQPLQAFLAEIRSAMGMEVAFLARLAGDSRTIEAVSVESGIDTPIAPGDADDLDSTYCQMILDGALDPIVKDATANARVARLEVTARLKIRSYISSTVVLRSGCVFGTLCCYSTHARSDLQLIDAAALQAVADAIAGDIDRHGKLTENIWRWGVT